MASEQELLERIANESPDQADRDRAKAMLRQRYGGHDSAPPPTQTLPLRPEQQERIKRGTAAGYTPPPTFTDKLRAAFDPDAMARDLGAYNARFSERFGFGLPAAVADATGISSPEQRARAKAASPEGAQIGGIAGDVESGIGGPEAALGKTVATVTNKIPLLVNSTLGRVANPAIVGAATAGGGEAARTAAGGGDAKQAGADALSAMPGGAFMGGLFGTMMALGRAGAASKGAQARRLVEKYGGEVGPSTAGRGGAFDQELAGLEANDKGIGAASRGSAERILDKADEIHQTRVAEPYRAERAAIEASGEAQRPVVVDDVYNELVRLHRSAKLAPGERDRIARIMADFEEGGRYYHPGLGFSIMTEGELNDFKSMLQRLSRTGEPGEHTVPEAALARVAKVVKEKVDQGPFADLNRRYHEGMEDRSELRRALQLGPKKSRNELAEVNRVRNVLQRQGQQTVTEGGTTLSLDDLKQMYPELVRDIQLPEVLRAKGDLQFRLSNPSHGGLIQRLKNEGIPAGMAFGIAQMLAGPKAAAGAAATTHMLHVNGPAITGRLLYTPAAEAELAGEGLSGVPGLAPTMSPILRAAFQAADVTRQRNKQQPAP